MDKDALLIGIDIGWSAKTRSCAVAVIDPKGVIDWPKYAKSYGSAALVCCRFKLSELINFLTSVQRDADRYEQTFLVLDGPLGPTGRPSTNRSVDSVFRRGDFHNRMRPVDIDNADGKTYVDATYQVAHCFSEAIEPWVGGSTDSRLIIAETHPTVGMALMVPKYGVDQLPSRKRPLIPPKDQPDERVIGAKSDFYWRVGANEKCGVILESPAVAHERHHENVAGLYCLAVSSSISRRNAVSFGDKASGVYVFPNEIDSSWLSDLKSVDLVAGNIKPVDRNSPRTSFEAWNRPRPPVEKESIDIEAHGSCIQDGDDEVLDSDFRMLLLNDNGGIWEKHNDWLEDAVGPVRLRCITTDAQITLERAGGLGQWRSKPTPLSLARVDGFGESHLSNKDAFSKCIQILDIGL